MTATTIAPTPLVYNGEIINSRNDMLSLRDMWRVAGSDPSKQPARWRELPATSEFVEYISVNLRKSEVELFEPSHEGRHPATWAHWQVGLAYAKYLSPAFHRWCNEVVPDRMEGRIASGTPKGLAARDVQRTYLAYHSIGKAIGFTLNEASIRANIATIKTTGVDVLEMMGATQLISEAQQEVLTPTMIGDRLGGLSAPSINKRLEALGFQESGRDSRGNKTWHPTEKGKPFGRWYDTGKAHSDGASISYWKWFATIVDEIRGSVPVLIVRQRDQPAAG